MSTTERSRTGRYRMVAVAAVIAAAASTGCSSDEITERVIEEGVEREAGEDVDIDLDDGNIRIETDEGTFEMNADGDGNVSIEGESADGDFSIDSEDGVTVIESDDGRTVIAGGAGIPDDFPDSVPLPAGFEPEFSQSMTTAGGDGWILGGPVAGSMSELAESWFGALESAGFERRQVAETPDSIIFGFDDGEHSVSGIVGEDGGTYLNLTVADSEL